MVLKISGGRSAGLGILSVFGLAAIGLSERLRVIEWEAWFL